MPKALRSATQRISARRGAEQAPREKRLLPAGNRSLPFFIGIAGTIAHMVTGGSPGAPLYGRVPRRPLPPNGNSDSQLEPPVGGDLHLPLRPWERCCCCCT